MLNFLAVSEVDSQTQFFVPLSNTVNPDNEPQITIKKKQSEYSIVDYNLQKDMHRADVGCWWQSASSLPWYDE